MTNSNRQKPPGFIPPHGGYKDLVAYQMARIVYDGTIKFCEHFMKKSDLICVIHQTNYLLDQLLRQLEKAFVEAGGLRERMTRARLAERSKPI